MRRRRRRDDTWVVKEDEFHPDPRVAAVAADDAARAFAQRNLKERLARCDPGERAWLEGLLTQIEREIREHAEVEEIAA